MDFRELITSLHVEIILPETLLLVSLLVAVGLDLVLEKKNPFVFWIPVFGLFGSVFLLILQCLGLFETATASNFDASSQIAFVGSFQGDAFSLLFRIFLAFSAGFTFFFLLSIWRNPVLLKPSLPVYLPQLP
jgi:NAD(P)H-quinone oxidoreductase subunit 2